MTLTQQVGQVNEAIHAVWTQYHTVGFAVLGAVGLVALAVSALVVKRQKKPIKPAVVFLGSNLALLLNAEGMWDVLTEKADVPGDFAVLVFAVFEICLMISMDQARTQYRRTSVFYTDGERDRDGRARTSADIKKPGDPGAALGVVWFIALLSGTVVATNGGSATVVLLRLGLPVMVVLMWWVTLTAAGRARRRSRFKFHPQRVMERRGWFEADADDDGDERLKRQEAERREELMVTYGHRLEAKTPGTWLWRRRLAKQIRGGNEAMVDRVAARVQLVTVGVERIAPSTRKAGTRAGQNPVTETGRHNGHQIGHTNGHDAAALTERLSQWPTEQDADRPTVRLSDHRSTESVTVSDHRPTESVTVSDHAVTDRPTEPVPASDRVVSDADEPSQAWASATAEFEQLGVADDELRDLARDAYRTSVANGEPLGGAELARKFGKVARWGTRRIAEVREEEAGARARA